MVSDCTECINFELHYLTKINIISRQLTAYLACDGPPITVIFTIFYKNKHKIKTTAILIE